MRGMRKDKALKIIYYYESIKLQKVLIAFFKV